MKRMEEIEARLNAAPEGPYLRDGRLVYKLNEHGANYFFAGVQSGGHCRATEEEKEAIAAMFAAAPADLRFLLDFAKAAREALERHVSECFYGRISCSFCQECRRALALLESP